MQDKQFLNELVNCKQLKDEIVDVTTKPEIVRTPQTEKEIRKSTVKPPGNNNNKHNSDEPAIS